VCGKSPLRVSGDSYVACVARCERGGSQDDPSAPHSRRELASTNLTPANKREERLAEEQKQEALKRGPFAICTTCRNTTIYLWSILQTRDGVCPEDD